MKIIIFYIDRQVMLMYKALHYFNLIKHIFDVVSRPHDQHFIRSIVGKSTIHLEYLVSMIEIQ